MAEEEGEWKKALRVISLLSVALLFMTLTDCMIHIIYSHTGKNSCPLCQAEGIAEEIRSSDIETASDIETTASTVMP